MMEKTARQARLDRQRNQQRRGQTKWLVYIVIGAVVVVGLLIVSNIARGLATGPIVSPSPRTYGQQSGNVLGDPNAPVQLIEIGDFQCPVCKIAYQQLEKQVITQYVDTGKVSYTFEAVGYLDGTGNLESTHSAQAAYCAGAQNKFWEYHDYLYTNQAAAERSGGFADDRLLAMAKSLGLDMGAFNSIWRRLALVHG